ncbi:MAG: DUF1329 domain-containing protein [Pseudomonadales bacterium]|nr:DUF1329 domain-containing protein [Pseudomonadales bacterium]
MLTGKLKAAILCAAFVAGAAQGGVSPEQAARLGKELTPTGAEMAGNADGSIPPWNPQGAPIPADFVPGSDDYKDPYKGEKPLFTIDNNNWKQYADNLTEGTKAIMEKLGPDGFRLNVYPTKRDFVYPDWVVANTIKNATAAQMTDDGQKLVGNLPGVPFPIPQSGMEVMWNHMIRYQEDYSADYDVYYVSSDGKPILSTTGFITNVYTVFKEENRDKEVGDTPWVMLRINYNAPARRAGEILLVHEPGADYTEGKGRQAWQYLTGQRRVRLAPAVSFDTPNPGVAGTSTYDDSYIYNGSLERFNWTLVGKKEMYIPNGDYDFIFQTPIEDMLLPKMLDPDKIRWEKHRVWVVEANLKEGMRHLYSKRRYYIDEDTWHGMTNENYDGRGTLWRVQYAYGANLYDVKSYFAAPYGAYDLLQGIYNLNGKPIPGKYRNGVAQDDKYFSPKGMARSGVR